MATPEKRKAYSRRYYHSHKSQCAKKFKEWRIRNKEHRKRYMDAYNAKRKHLRKEYDRLRYLRPDNVLKRKLLKAYRKAYMYDWNQRNKERKLARCYRDRALKRQNLVGDLSKIIKWMKSWRTPKFVRCYWCGRKSRGDTCHGDHIIALSDGGAHSLENLCISCSTCNMKKHNKPLQIWNTQIQEPVLL